MSGTDSYDEAPYCLVLSGGGAKGIYHVGVLKALHELHIPVGAYIGNSIGALIAGGMAMGDDSIIDTMGELFTLDQVLQLPEELVKDGKLKLNARNLSSFKEIYRSVIARKGLDTTPMKQMIDRYIKEDVLRASGIDFGIVTFNISSLKPTEIFLEDMPPGTVRDYILASAAFFGFEMPEIDGESYVDGGIYNNTPYQMARQRGYLRIIVVDITGSVSNGRCPYRGPIRSISRTPSTWVGCSISISRPCEGSGNSGILIRCVSSGDCAGIGTSWSGIMNWNGA